MSRLTLATALIVLSGLLQLAKDVLVCFGAF
jgi:hypothetical protein